MILLKARDLPERCRTRYATEKSFHQENTLFQTDFGVFIDIGVGQDGLAHISHFKDGHYSLMLPSVNDSVEVVIDKIREDGKISLSPVY